MILSDGKVIELDGFSSVQFFNFVDLHHDEPSAAVENSVVSIDLFALTRERRPAIARTDVAPERAWGVTDNAARGQNRNRTIRPHFPSRKPALAGQELMLGRDRDFVGLIGTSSGRRTDSNVRRVRWNLSA